MASIKEISSLKNLRLSRWGKVQVAALFLLVPTASHAESCLAPVRPFVPSDSEDARAYADIIRQDFENYISDIQSYFRCLDGERARAFEEAREVSEDYGRFLQLVGD